MKFLVVLMAFFSIQVLAQEAQTVDRVTIYSRGQANGFCDGGPSSYFCYDQLKRRAEQDSSQDADNQCRSRGGRLETYSGSCSFANCNPYSLPSSAPSQFVNCYISCTSTCLIERNP